MKMHLQNYMNYYLIIQGYSNLEEVKIEDLTNGLASYFNLYVKQESNLDLNSLFNAYLQLNPKKQAGMEVINYLRYLLSFYQKKVIRWHQVLDYPKEKLIYAADQTLEELRTGEAVNYPEVFNLLLTALLDLKAKKEEEYTR